MEMDELAAANITADSSAEDFADHVLKKRRELKHGGHSVLIRGLYCFQVCHKARSAMYDMHTIAFAWLIVNLIQYLMNVQSIM